MKRHEIGGLDEQVGELAIGMLDAVDVGRVDEGQALGDVLVRDDPEAERFDAGERAITEGSHVVRVGEDDGRPRRRAKHARRLAARPAIVLKSVLLPAPVGPRRSTTTGASRLRARTRRWPAR